ncbi:hypothetical protein MN116_001431 [Schistosoma mekongi]|uniref:Glycine cleavage system P protein n=1 Tax=Schistosoma mekongi TaxID=38744 RepID=A0AAE1ZLS4_SCHME|nr:hypothetical protein MN116_001431 [Schistosoma mekongi]
MLWSKLSFVQYNRLHYNFVQTLYHQCHLLRIRAVSRSPYLRIHNFSSGSDISDIDAKPEGPEADFVDRHIGPSQQDINHMLQFCGFNRIEDFIAKVIPEDILLKRNLKLENQTSEAELIKRLKLLMNKNEVWRSYIGQGYYGTITPSAIQRNIFENPGWYTSYTPYQPEISQGRLESLFNYQTMVSDLTGLPRANASLLDEGTASAEAMCLSVRYTKRKRFLLDKKCHQQTIDIVTSRAKNLDIEIEIVSTDNIDHVKELINTRQFAGYLLQYPDTEGNIWDEKIRVIAELTKSNKMLLITATDLLALTLIESPGSLGANIAVGSSQRFGIPMGFGGPHAAFISSDESLTRLLPGRIVGLSKDAMNQPAYRLALQTREQHIRRDKATSNICTAQALLANMASFYAVYHGPEGLKKIASRIHRNTLRLVSALENAGYKIANQTAIFDTIKVLPASKQNNLQSIRRKAFEKRINLLYYPDDEAIGVSVDETLTVEDFNDLMYIFEATCINPKKHLIFAINTHPNLMRKGSYLTHPVFNSFHSETELLRYMKRLENKDVSLAHSMIPLGSCTMKLNGTTELLACSWDSVNKLHPFVPKNQVTGYLELIAQLENDIKEITGYDYVSLAPNSGAQGEYAGLMAIKGYLGGKGEHKRTICLIPTSAHGTNPASAQMAGMIVKHVQTTKNGCLDLDHLKEQISLHKDNLAAIMITYPSTFGVFDSDIPKVCDMIHEAGGQVYMDGANLNAQVGLCRPADVGSDVSHLNLHKTFSIPHGGGGPGCGPVCVKSHLAPFLPQHYLCGYTCVNSTGRKISIENKSSDHYAVCSAPFGSASLFPISWVYMRLLGPKGVRRASQIALLNANYMLKRLRDYYDIHYVNNAGMCAHEFIIDCSQFSKHGIDVNDIAKRLMDYGFHSPTMSWPATSSLMIEPTESESKAECDRLCDALILIKREIDKVITGKWDAECNPLKLAPHTMETVMASRWNRPYTREDAAFPAPWQNLKDGSPNRLSKVWPTVGRLNDAYGDQHLVCTCQPLLGNETSSET